MPPGRAVPVCVRSGLKRALASRTTAPGICRRSPRRATKKSPKELKDPRLGDREDDASAEAPRARASPGARPGGGWRRSEKACRDHPAQVARQSATHVGTVGTCAPSVARAARRAGLAGRRRDGAGGAAGSRQRRRKAMSLNGTVWAPIGPSPMNETAGGDNGLVTSIAVNPNNANVLYLGTAQGGVWRSGDAGHSWTPLFDHQPALGIGEPGGIAIDPNNTNTIYVGTSGRVGSAEPDMILQPSAGLFKSTDGGTSWIALGSGFPAGNTGNANQFALPVRWINVIIVDPADSNVLYLASSFGVFTSSDGGQNWTGRRNRRRHPLARARSLHAGERAHSPCGRIRHRRFQVHGRRGELQPGAERGHAAVAAALGAGSFGRVVVALAPPTSPPNVNGMQVIYVAMSAGDGPDPSAVPEHGPGGYVDEADRRRHLGHHLRRLCPRYRRGSGLARRREERFSFSAARTPSSRSTRAPPSPGSTSGTPTHTWTSFPGPGHHDLLRQRRRYRRVRRRREHLVAEERRRPPDRALLQYRDQARRHRQCHGRRAAGQRDGDDRGGREPAWSGHGGDGWDVAYDGSSPPVLYATSGGPGPRSVRPPTTASPSRPGSPRPGTPRTPGVSC